MTTPLFVEPLQQLISHCEVWCDVAGRGANGGLSHSERASLLQELRALAAEVALPPVARNAQTPPWARALHVVRSAFSAGPDAAECEQALLKSYERVCDSDPPLRVSSTLLRHYGSIKRAAHLTSSAFSKVRGRAITPPSPPASMTPVAAPSR